MSSIMAMNRVSKILTETSQRIAHGQKFIDKEEDLDLYWAGYCTALDYLEDSLSSLLFDMKEGFI